MTSSSLLRFRTAQKLSLSLVTNLTPINASRSKFLFARSRYSRSWSNENETRRRFDFKGSISLCPGSAISIDVRGQRWLSRRRGQNSWKRRKGQRADEFHVVETHLARAGRYIDSHNELERAGPLLVEWSIFENLMHLRRTVYIRFGTFNRRL